MTTGRPHRQTRTLPGGMAVNRARAHVQASMLRLAIYLAKKFSGSVWPSPQVTPTGYGYIV